jgi:hypothetical protein
MRVSSRRGRDRKLRLLLLLLFPVTLCSQVGDNDDTFAKFTRAQLQAAIEQTRNESTRLEGLHELIRMAGLCLYEGSMVFGDSNPDPEPFRLRGEAAKAVAAFRDMRTVEKALDSPHRSLRLWGVMSFEIRSEYREAWQALVPKLVNMLNDPDSGIRLYTVDKLWNYPEGVRAIADREPLETNLDVLLRMARSGSSPHFYHSLLRLLSSTDTNVRQAPLFFIYFNLWNEATAPMWRLGFDNEVYERVQRLSHSASQEERESALKALSQLDVLR